MRGPETDHANEEPMRGLQINCIGRGQHLFNTPKRHYNYSTDPAQRAESVKMSVLLYVFVHSSKDFSKDFFNKC